MGKRIEYKEGQILGIMGLSLLEMYQLIRISREEQNSNVIVVEFLKIQL